MGGNRCARDLADAGNPVVPSKYRRTYNYSPALQRLASPHNTQSQQAKHPSGQWYWATMARCSIRSASLILTIASGVERVRCSPERGRPLTDRQRPFEIHQESSGGERWNGPVHMNRDGRVPIAISRLPAAIGRQVVVSPTARAPSSSSTRGCPRHRRASAILGELSPGDRCRRLHY